MAINFKKITLDSKSEIDSILRNSHKRFCEFTFGNIFCWAPAFNSSFCISEGTFVFGNVEKEYFSVPVGKCPEQMIKDIKEQFPSASFFGIDESELSMFDGFSVSENIPAFDYIYESAALMTLKGKKLAAKRNHINAFESTGSWHTKKIEKSDTETLIEFNKEWCEGKCKNAYLTNELCAAERALKNFEQLALFGLMLYKDDRLVAYSFGEPINADTFCVHVEKADTDVRGAYQMINREFAREFCKDYLYINREDDAGDTGVRRAKLSYYPTEVGRKYKAK